MNKQLSKHSLRLRAVVVLLSSVLLLLQSAMAEDEPALFVSWDDPNLEWVPCPGFFGDECFLSFIHGDPAEPSSDVLFKIPGGYTMVPHKHTSAERMVLMNGEMLVRYKGQDKVTIKKGMYIYGPPERSHHGKCISEEPCVLFVAFVQPVDALETASQDE